MYKKHTANRFLQTDETSDKTVESEEEVNKQVFKQQQAINGLSKLLGWFCSMFAVTLGGF